MPELVWARKDKCIKEHLVKCTKSLVFCREESLCFGDTSNVFIEGDNLDALKLLHEEYGKKIKMIYIDPPYNTGKKRAYEDRFTHANWLNMMYPRLKLARSLLRNDGVIFISIDDHEVANLRKICDEIFGEENFVAEFIWNGKSGSEDDKNIRNNHEYAIAYSKSNDNFIVGLDIKEESKFPLYDKQKKDNYKRQLLRKWGDNSKREDRPNLFYPIKMPSEIDFFPKLPDGTDGCWRWCKEKMKNAITDDCIEFKANKNGRIEAYEKIFESDISRKTKKFQSLLLTAGNTAAGTEECKLLFNNKKIFDRPKPTKYISILNQIANTNDNITLDFFAGSCSTAHAVFDLNKEDGGTRKFIMVQLAEPCDKKSEAYKAGYKTIADIGKERIRRVAKKIKKEDPKYKGDLGFKVFKIA